MTCHNVHNYIHHKHVNSMPILIYSFACFIHSFLLFHFNSLHTPEDAQMGFINESRVVVLEGLSVTLCASLINITVENFQRYNQHVDIYTERGTALGEYKSVHGQESHMHRHPTLQIYVGIVFSFLHESCL